MIMGFVNKDEILAFPVAFLNNGRPSVDNTTYAHITTEYAITELLRDFPSYDGFVVNKSGSIETSDTLAFVIHGYYFEAAISDIANASSGDVGDTISASIKVQENSSAGKICLPEIFPITTPPGSDVPKPDTIDDDVSNKFTAVNFTNSTPDTVDSDTYIIPLFDISTDTNNNTIYVVQPEYGYRLNREDASIVWNDLNTYKK